MRSSIISGLPLIAPRGESRIRISSEVSFDGDITPLWFDVPAESAPVAANSDAFALAALLPAMRSGRALRIEGPVSPTLLANLDELQAIYSLWFPAFSRVEIAAETSPEGEPGPRRALAFSGGVDSFHTLLTSPHPVDRLLYVEGLDTIVEDDALLVRIRNSIRATAAELGVPLFEVATNVKEFLGPYADWWAHTHTLALATVAHAMTGSLAACVISADHTYGELMPHAAHPLLLHHFGSHRLEVEPYGWGTRRVDKVAAIAQSPVAMRHLRVCWKNYEGAFNCGRCEKCLRTKAELAANNALESCLTFDGRLDLEAVRAVDMSFGRHLSYGRSTRDRARQNGNHALADALTEAIDRAEATHAAARVAANLGAAARSDGLVPVVGEHRDILYSMLSAHHGRWLVSRVMRDLPGKVSRKVRRVLTPIAPRLITRSPGGDTEPPSIVGRDAVFIANPFGNLGDNLIAEACVAFLRESGVDIVESNGALEEAARRNDSAYLSAALGRFTGVVYFAGGGNIGIYPDNAHRRRVVIEHAPRARRFLVMPQSCFAPEPALRDDRVEVWARELASLRILRAAKIDARLVPDAVFGFGDRIAESPDGNGVLSILRTPGTCHERVEHGFIPPGATADPTFRGTLPEAMATIAPFRTVLSDRLHGGILASMMRKRVGFLPVGYHKIRSFYDTWFTDDPGVSFVETAEQVREFLTGDTRSQLRHREVFMERAAPALQAFLDSAARQR